MSRVLRIAAATCLALSLYPLSARAEMWCAYPLWVHEWGVQSFARDGRPSGVPLPDYFHRSGPGVRGSAPSAVRDMPPDTGERELPVLQFYSGGSLSSPIPLGLEVGFTRGRASRWFPQVDRLTPAAEANGPAAQRARAALLLGRARQTVLGPRVTLGADPTRQLEWARLALVTAPAHPPPSTSTPWVATLRANDRALWVVGATESERFVFYEAETSERVALSIEVGPHNAAGRRHFVLRNTTQFAVHDVMLVHGEGTARYVFYAPSIPAGASAGLLLEDHRVAPADYARATRERLRTLLVDPAPAPPAQYRWDLDHCVMQRDPSLPVERAEGHRLYAVEVDALLSVWGARFFDQPGTTLLYREDIAYLDAVMPLSIYTDMYNFALLRRTGLAVQLDVALPTP